MKRPATRDIALTGSLDHIRVHDAGKDEPGLFAGAAVWSR
jgi:hypothetical protein